MGKTFGHFRIQAYRYKIVRVATGHFAVLIAYPDPAANKFNAIQLSWNEQRMIVRADANCPCLFRRRRQIVNFDLENSRRFSLTAHDRTGVANTR